MPIDRTAVHPPTVTGRIQRNHLHYGGSDSTAQYSTSAGKSLNYANGPTLIRPDVQRVYALPAVEKWEDAVGLFGTENKFVLYTFTDKDTIMANACYEDDGYECGDYSPLRITEDAGFKALKWDSRDVPIEDSYEQATVILQKDFPKFPGELLFVSVEIVNNKTDNIYNDDWLDTRLYSQDRIEHPYKKMYVPFLEPFYAGFHARNTRRLPYDVDIVIGKEVKPLRLIKDQRLVRRAIEYGDQY